MDTRDFFRWFAWAWSLAMPAIACARMGLHDAAALSIATGALPWATAAALAFALGLTAWTRRRGAREAPSAAGDSR